MGTAPSKEKDDGLTVITPVGTASFVHVWEPHAFADEKGDKGEPNYGLILVFDKKTDFTDMRKACGAALMKKWGDKAKSMKSQFRLPFRPASDYEKYGEPFDRDDDSIMVIFKSRSAPGVVDARAKPIMNQMDFYPGCLARVSCYAHAYDTRGNKGVTFLLNNVQKTGDGERLAGARKSAEEDFGGTGEDENGLDDIF